MLDENKNLYRDIANIIIPDWELKNKNDLVREAIDNKSNPDKFDGYISAIMVKYWSKINQYYQKTKLVTTPEDIHSWLVSAILYAIEHHSWDNPDKAIYNDPNGPDKVINRFMECKRITFYQQLNRYNRKINSEMLSLDSLTDDYKDMVMPCDDTAIDIEYHDIVSRYFEEGEHIIAFILDAIMYEDVFSEELELKKLYAYFRKFDSIDASIFSNKYAVSGDLVLKSISELQNMNPVKFKKTINYNLLRLNFKIRKEDI